MTITPSSLAAIVGVGIRNDQFAVMAQVIPQKNVIIGTFDKTTFSTLSLNVPIRVYSPQDVGTRTGFGFMLHRLAKKVFKAGSVETWIVPQDEAGSPAKAAGSIAFAGSSGVVAGVMALYIANERVAINTMAAQTAAALATAVAAAINALSELSVTASITTTTVTITSKSAGPWGNGISIAFSLGAGEALPSGVVAAITAMTGGTGIPDITPALNALGTGDGQNEKYFTNLIHGYGLDTATLDAISIYNGVGNGLTGNYKKEIARPFRSLVGDVTPLTAGLTDALTAAGLRKLDRTNGLLCVPGSYDHPQEIAAQALGIMAVTNSIRAEEGYINKTLDGVSTGAIANRWTNDYDNRDQAVQGGVSTTFVENGAVTLQNVISFYRPTDVAPESNGYRAMRNISIIQNMLYNFRMNFKRAKWQGITIVQDSAKVTNITSRMKARDTGAALDDLVALADVFAGNAWLYTAAYSKANVAVTLRAGLTGFDITFPVILSGESGINNSLIIFDTSIAILLVGGAA